MFGLEFQPRLVDRSLAWWHWPQSMKL